MNLLGSLFSRRPGPGRLGLSLKPPDGRPARSQAGPVDRNATVAAPDAAPMPLPTASSQDAAIQSPLVAAEPSVVAQPANPIAKWIPRHTSDLDTTYIVPSAGPAAEPAAMPDIATLLSDFETLGDNPEFGLLREALGAPPDGLFGFGTMYPNALITLLRNRFAGFVEVETLSARIAWGRYYVDDKNLGLNWRTDVRDGEMDEAAVLVHEALRLARLQAQLIANLTGDRRLFVYAGPASSEQMSAIRAAMQSYGANTLLHVVTATDAEPRGQVTRQAHGLLRGTLGRYGNASGGWTIATGDWIDVCRAAHRLWRPGGTAAT